MYMTKGGSEGLHQRFPPGGAGNQNAVLAKVFFIDPFERRVTDYE